jgi:hypothetical protein
VSRSGLTWYVGPPGCGKTYRALQDARELIRETGYPLLVIDSQGVEQLEVVPRATSVSGAIDAVWRRGEHAAYVPENAAQVEALCRACLEVGHVILLVDESAYWLTSRHGGGSNSALLRLMRAHRHAAVHLLLTTQHFSGDLPQEALACSPTILAGAIRSPAALAVLEKWYGADPAQLAATPPREFLTLTLEPSSRASNVPSAESRGGALTAPPSLPGIAADESPPPA